MSARISFRMAMFCSMVATASLVGVSSASADGGLVSGLIGANCGATSTPFSQWGDSHQYYFVPNGGFEPNSQDWTLTGWAGVTPNNEPFHVHATTDSHSLAIPSGGSATSSPVCFGLVDSGIRFFAVGVDGPATIHVRVITRGLLGVLSVLDGGTATVGTSWAPTPVFSTTLSQLVSLVGVKAIEIEISSTSLVEVDDFYVDPFVSH